MKTREQVLGQSYLTIKDVQRLLGVSWRAAKKAYTLADDLPVPDRAAQGPHQVRAACYGHKLQHAAKANKKQRLARKVIAACVMVGLKNLPQS